MQQVKNLKYKIKQDLEFMIRVSIMIIKKDNKSR